MGGIMQMIAHRRDTLEKRVPRVIRKRQGGDRRVVVAERER